MAIVQVPYKGPKGRRNPKKLNKHKKVHFSCFKRDTKKINYGSENKYEGIKYHLRMPGSVTQ